MNTTSERTINSLLEHVTSECKTIDREERFDAMLDECYSFEKVGGPFENMCPSQVLKECDPTAYRCGVNDWADGEGWVEINGDNYDGDDVSEARDEFVDNLNSELSDLENEKADIEETEDYQNREEDLATKRSEIAALEAFIVQCERYTF